MSVDLLAPPPPAPITDVTRRDLLRGVGALGAGWVVAGCAPNSDDPAGSGQTRSITHEFGTTEVPATPERIVVVDHAPTLGNLLALGLTPVAAGSYAPTGPQPFHSVLDPLVDGVQPIPAYFAELPLERVAARAPDLILSSGGLDEAGLYERLSGIAPTVPSVFIRTVEDIAASVTDLGATAGRSEQAAHLVDELKADLGPIAESTGETVTFATVYEDGSMVVWVEGTDNAIAEALGLEVVVPDVGEPENDRIPLSAERLPDLTADVLVLRQTLSVVTDAVASEDDALGRIRRDPLWERVRAVQCDRVVLLDRFLFTGGVFGIREAARQLRAEFTQ